MTSKVMLEYAEKLKIETPNFYDNFESSIKIGLKFINTFSIFDGAEYEKNLNHLYESSLVLKGNMPKAIDGMTSFYKIIKRLPKIQSNINFASRTLERRLSDLINKLNNSYKLISEFVSEIELKLNNIDSGTKDDSLLV
jgi:translation initiation factor 2B subunit (eIF-2B alpha/beta/delta family)